MYFLLPPLLKNPTGDVDGTKKAVQHLDSLQHKHARVNHLPGRKTMFFIHLDIIQIIKTSALPVMLFEIK